jgi:hypothetical protein
MTPVPPSPFPRKGATMVRTQGVFRNFDSLPIWGSPPEAA